MKQFKGKKDAFRIECESMRGVLQSSYRHAADYASTSQREPTDRSISMKRCLISAKGVHRDIQKILRVHGTYITDFEGQKSVLAGYIHAGGTDGTEYD